MRVVMNKMRQILYFVAICLALLTVISPINVHTSRTVSARTQQPAYVKTGAFVDPSWWPVHRWMWPFNMADSWLSMGGNDPDARNSLLKLRLSGKLIVPVQEPSTTGVPFKGWITKEGLAREGTISLVLKIYDQANGGTKLYEATHEVEVTHGQYFAIVQVPTETIAKSQTVWLEAASVETRELAFEPRQSFATRAPEGVVPNVAVPAARFCYTCGGSAFALMGAIPVPSGDPWEWGPGCAAPLRQPGTDYRPYLCAAYVAQ